MAKHNLPSSALSFVGREQEIATISNLLHDANCRLLTLCGPGGIGKTRLAIEAAKRNLDHFPDGIWMADLEPLTAVDEIIPTVAATLGFQLHEGGDIWQQIHNYLVGKRVLLIMDNFEHLLQGVGLVADLLESAPRLKIMVTSRESLKLREEWIRHIGGLDIPGNEQVSNLENYSAVRLFIEGAHRVRGDFSLTDEQACVVRLCQIVEGLPLAIELAASWLRVMPCAMIITEMQQSLDLLESPLGDMPERHRSMRATFDQSWHLLSPEEKDVFKKLAVFRGGFLREAAKHVVGASLVTLSNLVDKALVRVDSNGRYHLHSLIRQYAEEKLTDLVEDYEMVCEQHSLYYANFLHERESAIWYENNRQAHIETGAELDNIRRALAWAIEQEAITHIAKAIPVYAAICYRRSLWQEGYTRYKRMVLLAHRVKDTGVLWRALAHQGWFAYCLSEYEEADQLYQEALTIGRQSGWLETTLYRGFLILRLIEMAIWQGDLEQARQYTEEISTENYQLGKPPSRVLWVFESQGRVEYLAGNYQEAQKLLQKGLNIARSVENEAGIVVISNHLGAVYLAQNDYVAAQRTFEESLNSAQELTHWSPHIRSQIGLGLVATYLDDYDAAWSYFFQALEAAKKIGDVLASLDTLIGIARLLIEIGQNSQPLELLVYVRQHPSADWETRKQAERFLQMLDDTIPEEKLIQAEERAKTLNLDTIVDNILSAHQTTLEDEPTLSDSTATPSHEQPLAANQALLEPLTMREFEVLKLIADGHRNRQIANQLVIEVSTVKKHITRIFGKLDVNNRTQAVKRARELHLL